MPDSATSSSLVAVLRLTAATASCDANASATVMIQRDMACSFERVGFAAPCGKAANRAERERGTSLRRLARLRNQTFDVAWHALFHRQHSRAISRPAQRGNVGLGKALVLDCERFGHRQVRDRAVGAEFAERSRRIADRAPARIDRSMCNVV